MGFKQTLLKIRDGYVINQAQSVKLPVFTEDAMHRYRVNFSGRVQKVGFRLEVCVLAERLGLTGFCKNLENGDVLAEFQGPNDKIRFLLSFMESLKRIQIREKTITELETDPEESRFQSEADQAITESTFSCKRDNLTIRGTEYRPRGDDLPVAIVCHGFMAFQDTVRHYAKFLAQMGYAAYCFDFNGGSVIKGKSDGKTTDMSVLTEIKDLEAVMEYVSRLPYTDANHILLMGCSQGGLVSALTAAKRKERISKLVLFYPALCIPDDARAGKMMFARFDPTNLPEQIRCGPMKLGKCYVADVIEMDPYQEIQNYPGPVLIVHGTKDSIVHPDYSKRAFEVYCANAPSERERVWLRMIEGGNHSFSKKHDVFAIEELERFIRGDQVP